MKIVASLISIALTAKVVAVDGFFDLSVNTDFADMEHRSHIDMTTLVVTPLQTKTPRALLLTPRVSVFFDGTMDFSAAVGMRHQTPWGVLGHHVFWDGTSFKGANFHQLGGSLDFLTETLDFRVNYYHPVTKYQSYESMMFSSHKWMESEVVLKTAGFLLGAGPTYDLFTNTWGLQSKATIPMNMVNFSVVSAYDALNKFSTSFSISFRLYNSLRESLLHDPVSHKSRVQCSKEYAFVPSTYKKPVVPSSGIQKAEKQKIPEKKTSDSEVIESSGTAIIKIEPVVEVVESGVMAPISAPASKVRGWKDYLWLKSSGDNIAK